ncbi:helicase RepA family protein [Luteolibacter sp. GHJ8]|uniref:Helicase RepA family protein n=1 Tax=Luteolibacter rhizosphaerae TaxID=2989719 RepID=A0ABT3FYZ8_9BACT|nr:helicase RepA family protein [Luteolibacter rhizosphaerae]MCW1912647.1 helicase RepA family protein [Luteolibacter rhizosphaerae]
MKTDEWKSPPDPDAKAAQSFPITRADLLEGMHVAADFVEGLLTDGGASVVYGASNVGKSFWILDLAVHVATGRTWRDEIEVDQGAVVYVALEGSNGLKNRLEALRREGRLPDDAPLYVCTAPVSLLEASHARMLAESVKEAASQSNLPCRLVVLDTLARAMAGGDENKGQDMTFAVASIDVIRAATGAHVCVVHHCGKDEARGARGHSSLRAAVDTEIEIFRPEGERVSTVRVTKQRDLEAGEPMPFTLRQVMLGANRRGKPLTSCVVHHEDEMMASKPRTAGRKATYQPEAMLAYLPAANVKEWQERASEDCGVSRSVFYELKNALQQRKAYRAEVGTGRLVKE